MGVATQIELAQWVGCDHRVVDGWDAASFMQELKKILEAQLRLLA
jgi:2-oxoisovalerate dehydrogenase E2 component (dihydrolipoyl transacylase)